MVELPLTARVVTIGDQAKITPDLALNIGLRGTIW